MLDALFRPQLAIEQPTFRIDNSAALEAIGVKPRGKRDRYSYADIEPGREKLGELAQSYQKIDSKKRDPIQNQIVDLAANMQTYESLLGYFSFARSGVVLRGSGENGAPDKRADVSALMATAPQLREQINQSPGQRRSDRTPPPGPARTGAGCLEFRQVRALHPAARRIRRRRPGRAPGTPSWT